MVWILNLSVIDAYQFLDNCFRKNMHIYVSYKKYACFVIIWLIVRAYRLNVEFFYDSKVFILTEYEKGLYNLSRSDMWLLYYQECYCRHVYFHCYCIF